MLFRGYSSHPIRKFIENGRVRLTVRIQLGIQTWEPLPALLWRPPPPPTWDVSGDEYGDGTFRPYCLFTWRVSRGRSRDTYVLSFDSSVTVLRSNWVVGFAWIGLALAFVNERSWKMRESSPLFITYHHHNHHLWEISPLCQPWGDSKCFAIYHGFVQFCNGFAWIFLSRLILQWKYFV